LGGWGGLGGLWVFFCLYGGVALGFFTFPPTPPFFFFFFFSLLHFSLFPQGVAINLVRTEDVAALRDIEAYYGTSIAEMVSNGRRGGGRAGGAFGNGGMAGGGRGREKWWVVAGARPSAFHSRSCLFSTSPPHSLPTWPT